MRYFLLTIVFFASILAFSQEKPGKIYPEGKPGVDYNKLNPKGKKDGLWIRQWESTRNVYTRGQYKNGVPTGIWERYYPEGELMQKMNHVQDTTIIDVTHYFTDGKTVMSEGRYIKKRREGVWKMYNESGVLIAEESFKDSLLDGNCKYFYPTGKPLKVEQYLRGEKNGEAIEYYDSGKKRSEGKYLKDEREGAYKAWFPSGVTDCEGKYVKGVQDGNWRYFHEDGKIKMNVLYSMGKELKRKYENGTFKEYYDSSIPKSEYSYENGLKDGPFTEWYDKGEYAAVPGSPEDREAGIVYREKLINTQVKMQGDYVGDKLEGEVIYYRENGSIDRVEEWSDGVLMKTRQGAK